jgi:hypothetical protein
LEWLNLLNIITGQNMTVFAEIGEICAEAYFEADLEEEPGESTFYPNEVVECLELGIALYLTDGLSRLQNNMLLRVGITKGIDVACFHLGVVQEPDYVLASMVTCTNITVAKLQDPSHYQLVNTSIYRYGYGWGVGGQGGDFTIIFAAAILLLHVLVALIHIVVVIYGGWRSSAWGNLEELLALAINSAPTHSLQNTCAGISKSETWSQVVRVRETTKGHLEFVFDEAEIRSTGHDSRVTLGQEFTIGKAQGRIGRRVVAGKKYG